MTRLLSSSPIRPYYVETSTAYWQPPEHSAPPRAARPEEFLQLGIDSAYVKQIDGKLRELLATSI
jgi:hypothetical protein